MRVEMDERGPGNDGFGLGGCVWHMGDPADGTSPAGTDKKLCP